MKSGNSVWEEAIKTEVKQLTDFQKFVTLDSGESIPKGHREIDYRIVFEIKYEYLRQKAILIAGGKWIENEKRYIYSRVVCIMSIEQNHCYV